MATYTVYKLHFTTPVHFGDSRNDYSVSQQTIQSDTMYAALTACLAKIGVDIPEGGDLGCTISSLFPFYQQDEASHPIYFLPKPLRNTIINAENIADRKRIKKVSWLDLEYFGKAIKGEPLFDNPTALTHIHKSFLSAQPVNENFIQSQMQNRVTVSRTGNEDAKPYYMERITFAGYSGLYFIATGNTDLLERAIALLQHEGIGTDRNVGNGRFLCEKGEIEIATPASPNALMSLSIYIPDSHDGDDKELKGMLTGDITAYDFTRRGGWVTTYPYTTLRKGFVYAFLPASVFSLYEADKLEKGAIVTLNENGKDINHAIYRCGKALFIPVKLS